MDSKERQPRQRVTERRGQTDIAETERVTERQGQTEAGTERQPDSHTETERYRDREPDRDNLDRATQTDRQTDTIVYDMKKKRASGKPSLKSNTGGKKTCSL